MKNFLPALFIFFFAFAAQEASSQVLYTNTLGIGGYFNPGLGKSGSPIIVFDDALIPASRIPETDSMSVTKVKITIRRGKLSPANVMKIYASRFDPATVGLDSFPAIPPVLLGSFDLPASTDTFLTRTTINVGDSMNSIFNFKPNISEVFTGYSTIFIGVSFSVAESTGWELSDGPGANADVIWIYDVDDVTDPRFATYFGDGPNDPYATMRMEVFGKAKDKTAPVVLTNFDVQTVNNSNILAWSTSQETNSDYYGVELSTDGSIFNSIGQISAAGNSSTVSNYSYTDANPAAGLNYYRLKMVDLDNSVKYSDIRSVKNAATSSSFSAYPNPALEILYLNIPATNSERATLSVTNVSGQVVIKDEISVTTGNNKVPVKVNNLSSGTYIIKVQIGRQSFIQKFNKR